MTYVIKCKSEGKEKFLTNGSHLGTLDEADKYPSREKAKSMIDDCCLEGVAKVRRFIPKVTM